MIYQNVRSTLAALGSEFSLISSSKMKASARFPEAFSGLTDAIEQAHLHNRWFIPQFIRFAFEAWAQALTEDKISRWISKYPDIESRSTDPLTVAIVMAGNIPMAGLHDLLCTLAAGHHALVKMSASDDSLMPAVIELLVAIDPELRNRIRISAGPMKQFDAVIATGSNNTSRYFDFYFGKHPHIIRKNRNSLAVITGNENDGELRGIADDIFMYFGLGCRSVSKLLIPAGFEIEALWPSLSGYGFIADHNKYRNNYDYQKSIMLINGIPHFDNGYLLIRQSESIISPVSVVHYDFYDSIESVNQALKEISHLTQCVISTEEKIEGTVPPGRSQLPELWDYSDGIDTMDFLLNLKKEVKN